jgi:hypothetical protein
MVHVIQSSLIVLCRLRELRILLFALRDSGLVLLWLSSVYANE